MTPETIQETMRLWEQEPDKAKGKPTIKARADGSQAVLEAGPFSWRADLPQPVGGTNQAPSPTALLLSALAGCAVVFIRDTLAPQLGIRVDAVEATVQCEADARGLLGMAGAVPDLQNIRLDVQIQSPGGESDVEKLLQVWKERCPIYLALIKATDVTLNMRPM
ncbi:MAG TPA: OsmC family protein [Herpetosiphonaceae bacterium]|nr:OsmC family protein [Herpetosiphonaceae bacterium]